MDSPWPRLTCLTAPLASQCCCERKPRYLCKAGWFRVKKTYLSRLCFALPHASFIQLQMHKLGLSLLISSTVIWQFTTQRSPELMNRPRSEKGHTESVTKFSSLLWKRQPPKKRVPDDRNDCVGWHHSHSNTWCPLWTTKADFVPITTFPSHTQSATRALPALPSLPFSSLLAQDNGSP